MTAMGTYLLVSLLFVLGTMIEFAVVLILKERLERNAGRSCESQSKPAKNTLCQTCMLDKKVLEGKPDVLKKHGGTERTGKDVTKELVSSKVSDLTRRIDYTALVLFNFCYFIFNTFYFFSHK